MTDRSKRFRYDDVIGLTITPPVRKFDEVLQKYSPKQPRHPKGHPEGGKWKPSGAVTIQGEGIAGDPKDLNTLDIQQAQNESSGLAAWLTSERVKTAANIAGWSAAGVASHAAIMELSHVIIHLAHVPTLALTAAIDFSLFALANKLGIGPDTAWETLEHVMKKLVSARALEMSEAAYAAPGTQFKSDDQILHKLQLILNLLYQSQYAPRRKSMSPLAKLFQKFNPYHDPKNGQFTSGPGGVEGDKDGDGDVDGWDKLPGTGKTVGGQKLKPNLKPRDAKPAEDVGDLSPLGEDVTFWRAVAEKIKGMTDAERTAYMAEVDRLIDLTTPGKK